jgi:hypothetical protein
MKTIEERIQELGKKADKAPNEAERAAYMLRANALYHLKNSTIKAHQDTNPEELKSLVA